MRIPERLTLPLVESLGPYLFHGLYWGLRFEVEGSEHQQRTWEAGQPVVFITWHGRILPLLYLYRNRGLVMLVSRHRDGEYLARLGVRLGYDAVRGSSTHGGFESLRDLVRKVRAGRSLAITPDGPQGPREKFKPGALQVARLTGAPIIPVMAGCRRAWWVEGWDRFLVPKPFARIRVAIGKPHYVTREAGVRELADHARRLEVELQNLKATVDHSGGTR
ncbi:MAG: lysophospholipid acyltransferase family protein [Gemmatimonadota bacterium]|nr:MAG: lysophospholipid acyltransferase family protein [Gemmatimonadota bacterium]